MSAANWKPTHTIPESGLPARAEPNAALEPLQRIRHGVEVEAVENLGGWVKIRTDTGWEAWVDGTRLGVPHATQTTAAPPPPPPMVTDPTPVPIPEPTTEPIPAAEPAPEPVPEPEPVADLEPTHTVRDKGAPGRSGPDAKEKAAGRFEGGAEVEVLDTEGAWSNVRTADGTEAWISNRSLTAISTAQSTPEPITEEPTTEPAPDSDSTPQDWSATHTIPDGGLPAREKPEPGSDPLLRIRSDTAVRVVETQGAWSKVTIESGWEAWVDGRRLLPIGGATPAPTASAAPAPAAPADPVPAPELEVWEATHTIPNGGLSAWSEPKADRQPILRVKNGTAVQVVKTAGAWSRIRTEPGWEAWVDGRRLIDL